MSRERNSPLLGLNVTNDDEEEEAVEEEKEDLSCNQAMDDFDRQRTFQTQLLEQSGGSIDPETPVGTFEFDLQPYVNRTSARMGMHERHFTTRLRQTSNFVDTPHVVQALRDGLQRAMARVLNDIHDLHDDDRLYFNISSNRLSQGSFHGWGVRVGEWREGGDTVDAVLNLLSRALNSNEQFEMDDSFQLSITQVHHAPQGSGRKRHQLKPGHHTLDLLKSKKRSIVQIQNDNDLCCARALVTPKAKVDRHPQWRSFQRGYKIQSSAATNLHLEAHVPFGPCGYEELTQFSKAPSLIEYQILLVDADHAFHIKSFGPPAPDKQLVLLHEKGHYDVITSLSGFLGRSYVCSHYFKPYDHARKHRCKSKKTVLISPEQLKREQREMLNTRKKAIYEDVLNIVQNMSNWLFEDKQGLATVLRALRRRDLRGIVQGVQAFPRFYYLCRNSGLFTIEPPLWDMVYDEIKQDIV